MVEIVQFVKPLKEGNCGKKWSKERPQEKIETNAENMMQHSREDETAQIMENHRVPFNKNCLNTLNLSKMITHCIKKISLGHDDDGVLSIFHNTHQSGFFSS
jgi:hypothetical protein